MPVRMIHTVSRAEPYVFQPAVMAALAVLAVALLLREGRWLEGRALMKKRPWQNWFLVAEAAVDAAFFLVAFGIFLLGGMLIGWEGMPSALISEALGLLLGGLAIKGALLYCLLRTRRAGLVFALLSGPIALPWLLALVTPAPLLMPGAGGLRDLSILLRPLPRQPPLQLAADAAGGQSRAERALRALQPLRRPARRGRAAGDRGPGPGGDHPAARRTGADGGGGA